MKVCVSVHYVGNGWKKKIEQNEFQIKKMATELPLTEYLPPTGILKTIAFQWRPNQFKMPND